MSQYWAVKSKVSSAKCQVDQVHISNLYRVEKSPVITGILCFVVQYNLLLILQGWCLKRKQATALKTCGLHTTYAKPNNLFINIT